MAKWWFQRPAVTDSVADLLDQCLTRIERGEATVESCLAALPDYAEALRPLLLTALPTRPVTPPPTPAAAREGAAPGAPPRRPPAATPARPPPPALAAGRHGCARLRLPRRLGRPSHGVAER